MAVLRKKNLRRIFYDFMLELLMTLRHTYAPNDEWKVRVNDAWN